MGWCSGPAGTCTSHHLALQLSANQLKPYITTMIRQIARRDDRQMVGTGAAGHATPITEDEPDVGFMIAWRNRTTTGEDEREARAMLGRPRADQRDQHAEDDQRCTTTAVRNVPVRERSTADHRAEHERQRQRGDITTLKVTTGPE